MAKQRCNACGRPEGMVDLNGEGICPICEPIQVPKKQVEGVSALSVTAEQMEKAKAKPKKKVTRKKATKKKVAKKK